MGRKKHQTSKNSKTLAIIDEAEVIPSADFSTEAKAEILTESGENHLPIEQLENLAANTNTSTEAVIDNPSVAHLMVTHKDYDGKPESLVASKYSLQLVCKVCGDTRYYAPQDKFQVQTKGLCKPCLGNERKEKRNQRLRDKYLKQKLSGADGYDPSAPLKWNGSVK